jgi:acetyltransferase-like isoleucine patch superfamily enzyme
MIRFLKYVIKNQWQEYKTFRELKKRFPSCQFEKNIIIKGPLKNLKLGKNVIIQSNVLLHLGGMEWCEYAGSLEIGDHSCISPNTVIYAAGPGGIKIGSGFDCGPGVGIFSSSSDYQNKGNHIFESVIIGNNVILYSNVVIRPGVEIGNTASIAAGAVVTRDVPANKLVGGIPAKIINR